MSLLKLSTAVRGLLSCVALLVGLVVFAPSAKAAFHFWSINEIYTNNTGTLQFIELKDNFGGQNFVGGLQISATNLGGTVTHSFTLPNITLGGSTFNHSLLFGTAGVQAAGSPAPDFIIADNFLFADGGSISFFGLNSGGYTALPIDGSLSRTWTGGNAINSPTNYAGQTGRIIVPSPAPIALVAAGGCLLLPRRRSIRRMRQ